MARTRAPAKPTEDPPAGSTRSTARPRKPTAKASGASTALRKSVRWRRQLVAY